MTDLAIHLAREFWSLLGEMAPWLLFGFLVAGLLSVFLRPETIERHLGGRGPGPSLKAAALGVPLPLCSCGVIPVAASLRRHGASRGATAAFLLSTPQTGVDSILVTFSLLGPVFAVVRPVVAFLSGVIGGITIDVLGDEREGLPGSGEAAEARHPVPLPAAASPGDPAGERCADACCAGGSELPWWRRVLEYGFVTLPEDLARPLLLGILVAGLIGLLVPGDLFTGILGHGIVPMLAMMVIGIPIYVCATGSVPVAAALIAKGVCPGAALVFLMTGPATNSATIATVWKILGRRATIAYLAVVALTALGSGLLLDATFDWTGLPVATGAGTMLPAWLRHGSAVLLLVLLLRAPLARLLPWRGRAAAGGAGCDDPREGTSVPPCCCSHDDPR